MKKYDVIISGYIAFDRVIKIASLAKIGKTSIITNNDNNVVEFGGCGINVAVDLATLGYKTLPVIRVGDDYESSGFASFVKTHRLSEAAIKKVTGVNCSSCYLVENPSMDHITLYYPGSMDEKYFLNYDEEWFKESKFALMTVASRKDNEEFLAMTNKYHLPTYFGMKMDKTAFPPVFLRKVLKRVSGVFANKVEITYIKQILHIEHTNQMFSFNSNLQFVVVTNGKKGSTIYYRHDNKIEKVAIGIVPADEFVSTVGSGDAYMAGFIYGLIKEKDYLQSAKLGATLATCIIEGAGATSSAPDEKQLWERYYRFFGKE